MQAYRHQKEHTKTLENKQKHNNNKNNKNILGFSLLCVCLWQRQAEQMSVSLRLPKPTEQVTGLLLVETGAIHFHIGLSLLCDRVFKMGCFHFQLLDSL